ncbi:MAG: D-glycero-beta-D-manno-heptose 1,7-bisphosphate 7-phosphatase [Burkholderiaceae bacterium]|jgi:D-glycero-D-manno-heptose 1,7-bisphosphate phosphatase|nr:D-glycero-beta-D-manno-heptose 1,7-bisphosphate 7-phosphatase [Burkholderiaceae bacterium]
MKLVIVDRDGTLNYRREGHIQTPEQWEPIPGALDAVARLNQAGYHVVIAANLSGLGRGLYDMDALNAVHARMHRALAQAGGRIEAVFFCPHAPDEECDCRPPAPGLFEQIGARYKVDLNQMHAVSDSESGLQAAFAAGCAPHLVLTGATALAAGQPLPPRFPPDTQVHADLAAFAAAFLTGQESQPAALERERT